MANTNIPSKDVGSNFGGECDSTRGVETTPFP